MRTLTLAEIDCVSGGVENVQTMEEVVVTGKRLHDYWEPLTFLIYPRQLVEKAFDRASRFLDDIFTLDDGHSYQSETWVACTAEEAFQKLLAPGMSAPLAPQAVEGYKTDVSLAYVISPNLITQDVSTKNFQIVNTAQPGHEFQGTVTIQVYPAGSGAVIVTTGKGPAGENSIQAGFNDLVGNALFKGRDFVVFGQCEFDQLAKVSSP